MNELETLYGERETFVKYSREIPPELIEQIQAAEAEVFGTMLDDFTGHLPEEIEAPIAAKIVFAAEYEEGKLVRVGLSTTADVSETFDVVKDIKEEVEEIEDEEEESETEGEDESDPDSGRKRGRSIGFTVKFADGKEIKHTTAQRTMLEALRYMGLERASKYRGEMFAGYPLIGKEKRRIAPDRIWQKNIEGWWVYVHMGNPRAIKCLYGVANMLGIEMEIVMDDGSSVPPKSQPTVQPKLKGKRTMYTVNGSMPLAKNRAVYECVCEFIRQFPEATFTEISEMFPQNLQGSYGVVRTIEDINQRKERNRTETARWFLEPEEILTSADGVDFAVSNEWGDNFVAFQEHVTKSFGWNLTEL